MVLRFSEFLLLARQMPAGDVAGLVRQHADQLRRPLGADQEAGVDEYPLAARHEGVEAVVLDEHNRHGFRIEAGDLPDRRDEGPDRALDLGVADEFELTLLRVGGTKRRQRPECQTGERQAEEGDDASIHGRQAG